MRARPERADARIGKPRRTAGSAVARHRKRRQINRINPFQRIGAGAGLNDIRQTVAVVVGVAATAAKRHHLRLHHLVAPSALLGKTFLDRAVKDAVAAARIAIRHIHSTRHAGAVLRRQCAVQLQHNQVRRFITRIDDNACARTRPGPERHREAAKTRHRVPQHDIRCRLRQRQYRQVLVRLKPDAALTRHIQTPHQRRRRRVRAPDDRAHAGWIANPDAAAAAARGPRQTKGESLLHIVVVPDNQARGNRADTARAFRQHLRPGNRETGRIEEVPGGCIRLHRRRVGADAPLHRHRRRRKTPFQPDTELRLTALGEGALRRHHRRRRAVVVGDGEGLRRAVDTHLARAARSAADDLKALARLVQIVRRRADPDDAAGLGRRYRDDTGCRAARQITRNAAVAADRANRVIDRHRLRVRDIRAHRHRNRGRAAFGNLAAAARKRHRQRIVVFYRRRNTADRANRRAAVADGVGHRYQDAEGLASLVRRVIRRPNHEGPGRAVSVRRAELDCAVQHRDIRRIGAFHRPIHRRRRAVGPATLCDCVGRRRAFGPALRACQRQNMHRRLVRRYRDARLCLLASRHRAAASADNRRVRQRHNHRLGGFAHLVGGDRQHHRHRAGAGHDDRAAIGRCARRAGDVRQLRRRAKVALNLDTRRPTQRNRAARLHRLARPRRRLACQADCQARMAALLNHGLIRAD